MARYNTIHQYEPLRAPEDWSADGRRFVVRLTEILDDIYRRYGRLTAKDLGRGLNDTLGKLDTGLAGVQGETGALGNQLLSVHQAIGALDAQKLARSELLNAVYPVGAIYLSLSTANPTGLFGGVWQRLEGRFLLGADSAHAAGQTGGAAQHMLTEAELPAHAHGLPAASSVGSALWALSDTALTQTAAPSAAAQAQTLPAGGAQPHNNMPPYLAVYMWKRTE